MNYSQQLVYYYWWNVVTIGGSGDSRGKSETGIVQGLDLEHQLPLPPSL